VVIEEQQEEDSSFINIFASKKPSKLKNKIKKLKDKISA